MWIISEFSMIREQSPMISEILHHQHNQKTAIPMGPWLSGFRSVSFACRVPETTNSHHANPEGGQNDSR